MTPLVYAIRTARTRDLEALFEICLSWDGAPARHNPALLRELLTQALGDDDSTIYLALRGDTTVGFAHVTFQARPVRLGWRATIEELHGLPGEHVESALLEAMVGECRNRGDVIALYLLTQPDLEPRVFQFYESLGFRERGRDVLIWSGALEPT